ncbi:pseudouridine synthase [Methylocystis heyeri]|uniref:Pseudouridine synthase n=1 Tax=Methylocystis heyeri TaxID=391905 RepID=A0A6B8KML6_9HYPH|nr:pseudouridine synthase [Methylocystis heyeri]
MRRRAAPSAPPEKEFEGERVAKVMARAGACSRRDAEQWIAEGRVSVNGKTLASPAFNIREGDNILIDGKPMAERERTRLFLFHKPAGLVTSAKDPEGRQTVFDFLSERWPDLPRVVSVGRLDINTEGLLLLTNDGGLARTLELPATGWTRRYRVRAHGEVDQAQLDTLARGVTVEGVAYAPIEARLDRVQGANAWLTMGLTEGKNREIKRVLEHLALDVNRLIRISFGPFQLGDLAEGAVEEVKLKVLRDQLGKGLAELAGVDFSSGLREPPSAAEAQEKRRKDESRPRQHVSSLRKQRETDARQTPRARVERAVTADRKGRSVAVERIVVKGEKPAEGTRNARRFAAIRRDQDAPLDRKPRARSGEKPARAQDAGRPVRAASSGQGESRVRRERAPAGVDKATRSPRPPRAESREFERPQRRDREAAPQRERAPREKSFGERPAFEGRRPQRAEGAKNREFERPQRRSAEASPQRERAPREKSFGERPAFEGRRPQRAEGAKNREFERPQRRSAEAAPQRERAPREKTFGERPAFEGRRPPRSAAADGKGPPRGKPKGDGKPRGRPGGGSPRGGKPPARGPKGPR